MGKNYIPALVCSSKKKINNFGNKRGKEINDMYIKMLEYFNAVLSHK
jgi:hypothetical protein